MSGDLLSGAVAVTLLAVTGYFAAARAALDRMTPARAARLVEEERHNAEKVQTLLEDAGRTWAALTLLTVIPFIAATAIVTEVSVRYLGMAWGIAAAVIGTAVVAYIVTELFPRSIALRGAEGAACKTASVVNVANVVLRPITTVLVWIGGRIVPGAEDGAEAFVSTEAFRDALSDAEGSAIDPAQRAMIDSILELSETLVREVMVPRPDVVMVSDMRPLSEVVEVILENGYSRIPVHKGDERDDIAGVLYAKDVLARIHSNGGESSHWGDLIRDPYVVPELKQVDGLLRELQAEQVHLAIVVDEYGALAGIATIEDVLEEIVGEIVDEYDSEEELVEVVDEGEWRVDARLPVNQLEVLTGLDLPDEDWDTVGGLMYGACGHVPRPGESVETDGIQMIAEKVRGRRIAEILVTLIDDEHETAEPEDEEEVMT